MRLPTSLLLAATLVSSVRAENILHSEDMNGKEHASRRLSELGAINKKLNQKLENASIEIDGFLFSRNESSAYRTIEIIKEYIRGREEFIAGIRDLKHDVPNFRNVSFLDEFRWDKELNQTKNELSKLEQVSTLYQMLLKLNETSEIANNITKQFKLEGKGRHLASAINLTGELVEEIRSFIQEVSDVQNFTVSQNLTGVITSLWIEQLLDVQYWENLLKNKTEDLLALEKTKIPVVINRYIRPSLFVFIFVVGLAENGVLITIFARYHNIRKYRNMIILNLSIADTLSLIINLPVTQLYESVSSWDASPVTAQIFMFCRFLNFGLSVFSAVALCLQRFSTTLKLSVSSGSILRQSTKHNSIILIIAVWILSIAFAVPHSLYGCIYFEECFNTDAELHSKIANALFLINLIGLSLIPVIVITIFYWFTVRHLKLRALKLPADMPEHQKKYQRKTLTRSKNIMTLTPIIFAVTSLPYYFYVTIDSFMGTDINSLSYTIVKGVLYCLMFVNCSFNPAALYFTSGTFRRYIKMHFFWCKRRKDKHIKQQPKQRVLSNEEYNTMDTCL
jgi:hypothetical protein